MAVLNVKPLGNRILVKRAKASASKGGILLPDSAQEKPKEGEVLAVGPGKHDESGKLKAIEIKNGDKVLFGSYAGTEIMTDHIDEQYLILSEDEVLCIIGE
jgi:chaperonin GroES